MRLKLPPPWESGPALPSPSQPRAEQSRAEQPAEGCCGPPDSYSASPSGSGAAQGCHWQCQEGGPGQEEGPKREKERGGKREGERGGKREGERSKVDKFSISGWRPAKTHTKYGPAQTPTPFPLLLLPGWL